MNNSLQTYLDAVRGRVLPSFNPLLIDFCHHLSIDLMEHPEIKQFPDITALAFWLRKTHLVQLQQNFNDLQTENKLLHPRGLAFHIPPSNVDTMFFYSWVLSLLVGNANIVRIPSQQTASVRFLLDVVTKALDNTRFNAIKQLTYFISYGHEEEITALISQRAQARIIWGSNKTVEYLRKIPLSPNAKEIVFPDRYSFATIDAQTYLHSSSTKQSELIQSFYSDLTWFDQNACSSPRMIFWVGLSSNCKKASDDFYEKLHTLIQQRQYKIATNAALVKKTFLYHQALSFPKATIKTFSNELTIIELEQAVPQCREHCGLGLLYHVNVNNLLEIVPFITQQDQTMTHFGCSQESLFVFLDLIQGKGITRIVPIGDALLFDHVWDGYNLLLELSRFVSVKA